jgi:2-polyprenyl-3-methyl-5-hydroxy-6-metoxy-1,4-benzoquinol methylase
MAVAAIIDLAAARGRHQRTWASGDYAEIGTLIVPIAERLANVADLRAGSSVLDVACGSGNMAIAAARLGCVVTGVDYVGSVLERAEVRAAVERLDVAFAWGDAEELPFRDASFDAAASVMGSMFAPTMTAPRRSSFA